MDRLRDRLAARPADEVPPRLKAVRITPRDVADLAEAGDADCRAVICETARYVGRAIGLLGQTLNPAVVLLGGAMTFGGAATRTGRSFLDTVRETVRETTLVQVGGNMTIEFASLGNDAGLLGAAMVAKQASRE
jgi:glucokinase